MKNNIISKAVAGLALVSMVGYTVPVFAYTKDETVYSKLDANGDSYKTIVSTHIENTENEELINDISDLLNIKNTNGDETYTQDGNTFTWNANKNDIYYQGETKKELPIECNVKYELNGEEMTADEIAGKSGKVKITLECKSVKMYVPFVVVAGTILSNDNNTNIEVSNGKVVDDGSKTTIVGMAMPGLQESLGVSSDEVEIPNSIEITMETTNFETNSIVSYVTPKVVEKDDLSIFDELDDVYSKVNTLQSSSNQIVDGANTLKDGAETYSEKSAEFNSAMNTVATGVDTVSSNYSQIDDGISTISEGSSALSDGTAELSSGISELSTKLEDLPDGVSQLYAGSSQALAGLNGTSTTPGLVDGVNTVIDSATDATEGLVDALGQAQEGSENAVALLKANNTTLKSAIKGLKDAGLTEDSDAIKGLRTQIAYNEGAISEYETAIETAKTTKSAVQKKAANSSTQLTELRNGMASLQTGMTSINSGLKDLNTAAEQLPSALTQLSNGSKTLASKTKELSTGASKLSKGSNTLKSGISTLNTGTQQLNTASGQLKEGAETLSEGATTLAEGITKFNEEGIEKICDYINGDVKDVADRAEKLTELSKEYNNFTMLNEGNEGEVKFIMIIDGVKAQTESEQDKEDAIIENKGE